MQNSPHRRRHIGIVSKLTRPKIFGIPTSSMFSLIHRNPCISCPTESCFLLATFGFLKMLSFSKVQMSFFFFLPISDAFPDICGRLRGESIINASLRSTYCGICERLLVSAIPRVSRNRRGLQPIITEGCPRMIGRLPIHSSVDIGFCICTGRAAPDSSVRSDVIIFSYFLCLLTST